MKRETPGELKSRMEAAHDVFPAGRIVEHRRLASRYRTVGCALRSNDLAFVVNYSPLDHPEIVFSRSLSDMRRKFDLIDETDT